MLPLTIREPAVTTRSAPSEIVECDHINADIQLVDDDGVPRTDRVWLRLMVDPYSRMVLGWRLARTGSGTERGSGAAGSR